MTTIRDLAREAIKKCKSIDYQVEYFWQQVNNDKKLLKAILEPLVRMAGREAIYDLRHASVTALKFNPGRTTRGAESMASIADVMIASYLDGWKMPDGRTLGDMRGGELAPLAIEAFNAAHGWNLRARFYQAITERVPPKTLVRKAMKEADVMRLWNTIKATTTIAGQAG